MHKQSLALKFSFVFVVLSMAISLLTAAWQLAQGKSGSLLLVLETGAGLLLVLLPALLSKWLRFYLPAFLYFFFLAFIYCAIYLGDAYHFYYIPLLGQVSPLDQRGPALRPGLSHPGLLQV